MVYDQTEQFQLKEMEKKQTALLEYIREMANSLNTTLDFNFLLERMLAFASRVVPSDTGVIYLLDDQKVSIACTRGYAENGIPEYNINGTISINELPTLEDMYQTGKSIAIKDTAEAPRWVWYSTHGWVRSFIGTPLKVKDKIIGFLNLYSSTTGIYTNEDMERLQAFSDLTSTAIENARLYSELQQKADTDELTKLRNRRAFFDMASREVERAHRFHHPLSALMIDLDNFKLVNDNFGHPVGDLILIAIADVFRKHLRNIDLVARYGGDEFIILLPENKLENAREVANRLVKEIKATAIETQNGKARVGVSIGVSTLTPECDNLTSLIEVADRALYHAKEYGRGRVVTSQG
jgi:diguanylate cyclase (GGDEF)-like protein